MARDQEIIDTTVGDWTELSNSDILGEATFVLLGTPHYVRCTATSTKPAATLNGIPYAAGSGELKKALVDLVALSSPVRLWAKPAGGQPGQAYIDYA
jgi:hypothetical protein